MHLGLQIKFQKMTSVCLLFCLCSFIKVVQRTVVRQRYLNSFTHCFSTDYVGEFSLSFNSISNSPDKFRFVRLVNFFSKSVLPVILKEIQSFFLLLLSDYCINCDTLFRIRPKMFCNLP